MSFQEYARKLFLVHKCASCRQVLDVQSFNEALCPECRMGFDVAKTESCPNCFRAAFECTCQPKALSAAGSLCLRKLFFYHAEKDNEPQNKIIYFMKHHKSKRAPHFVASELYRAIDAELGALGISEPDRDVIIVNLPRGKRAVIEYGTDQSFEVCKALSQISGIPHEKLLLRKFGGKEQKKLSAAERKRNVKDLIYLNEKLVQKAKGKYVVLFDDVVTTGASMSACLPLLRKIGVKGVICCTLAFDLKNKRAR